MIMREVTEDDLRKDEFKGKKVEDYEFREDGKIVRKDRWIKGMKSIAMILFPREEFEISDIIEEVKRLKSLEVKEEE